MFCNILGKKGVKNWCIGLHGVYLVCRQVCSLGEFTLQFTGEDQCRCILYIPKVTCGQNEYRRGHLSPW